MSEADISHIDFNKKRHVTRQFSLLMCPSIDCIEYDDGIVLKRSGYDYEYRYSLSPTPIYNDCACITKDQYDLIRSNEIKEIEDNQ